MTWDDKTMSVGVSVLDDDHKKMVAMIDELFFGIKEGHGKDSLGKILDRLTAYTVEHFKREEQFFALTEYPDAALHTAEHADLTKRFLAFRKKYESNPTDALVVEMANFLWNWLVDHDLTFDKKYGPYLNSRGIT
jgi:hemerythrin-like metal-binding protein